MHEGGRQLNSWDSALSGNIYAGEMRGLSGRAALVFEELERRLIHGVYKFGAAIPTVEIAEEFGISRAPLTAALNQLRFAGYIEITPQVGSRVISPTPDQIRDFFIMFGLVEQQMARFAAERRTQEDIDAISRLCRMLTAVSAPLMQPTEEYIDVIDMYHMAIRHAAKSPLEIRRARGYFRFAAFIVVNGWPSDFARMRDNSNTYRPLVTEGIARGDTQMVADAMGRYVMYDLMAQLDQPGA
jgi:DNA-binding GntR family transcriptional regulator